MRNNPLNAINGNRPNLLLSKNHIPNLIKNGNYNNLTVIFFDCTYIYCIQYSI